MGVCMSMYRKRVVASNSSATVSPSDGIPSSNCYSVAHAIARTNYSRKGLCSAVIKYDFKYKITYLSDYPSFTIVVGTFRRKRSLITVSTRCLF